MLHFPDIDELQPIQPFKRSLITNWDIMSVGIQETLEDRKQRMVTALNQCCMACTICELGKQSPTNDNIVYDPHVLSNQDVSARIMCVGQNPGMNEIIKRTPFIGQSGANLDAELQKNGLDRSYFYITNIVKCFTEGNREPSRDHVARCLGYLIMEYNIIKPKLVVTLGACAFKYLCPTNNYSASLGKLIQSTVIPAQILPIYHPSPLNMSNKARKAEFEKQIRILCAVTKKLLV